MIKKELQLTSVKVHRHLFENFKRSFQEKVCKCDAEGSIQTHKI